jgi:23S rRNA (guanosine2251-2'-O)-methyltransferase
MAKRKHPGGPSGRPSSRSNRSGPSTSGSFTDRPAPYGKGGPKPRIAKGAHGKPAGRSSFRPGEGAVRRGEGGGAREDKPAFGKRPGKTPFRQGNARPSGRDNARVGEAKPRFDKDNRFGKPAPKGRPGRDIGRPSPALAAAVEPQAEVAHPRPGRPGRNQVWLYGLHAVKAALANPRRRHHRLLLSDEAAEALRGDASASNALEALAVEATNRDGISRLLPPGAVHQGAALLSEPLTDVALEDVLDRAAEAEKSVVLVLDQVTDPQNVGAILRSAAAFGADAVLVPDRHAPPETGALVKAASGAVEIVPLVRVINLARALEELKKAGFWIAGLDGQAPQTLAAADMTGKVVLVLGAEGEGLRRLTRDHCDILVRLPISARMESLNVSAAAAVALYELARKA